ncbi:MAG: class IV adenylate cyclase [Eubacterium sp.]|nr:class IV adenylate cyclase [Eubacterium sp.]
MIEVEVKLPIYKRSQTEKGLCGLGFIPGHLIKESDIYFTSETHDFMQADEALRIRRCDNLSTGESSCVLTFKGPKLDSVSMTRRELETGIADGNTGCEILCALGYKKLAPVTKLRQYYHLEGMTACVDTVEKLGTFLELEILTPGDSSHPEADRENALKKIEAILHDLGYSMSDTTRYSYLFMLQKKNLLY